MRKPLIFRAVPDQHLCDPTVKEVDFIFLAGLVRAGQGVRSARPSSDCRFAEQCLGKPRAATVRATGAPDFHKVVHCCVGQVLTRQRPQTIAWPSSILLDTRQSFIDAAVRWCARRAQFRYRRGRRSGSRRNGQDRRVVNRCGLTLPICLNAASSWAPASRAPDPRTAGVQSRASRCCPRLCSMTASTVVREQLMRELRQADGS